MLSRQCDVHFMFSNRADGAAFRDGLLEKNSAQLAKTKVIAWIYIAPNSLPSCPKEKTKCQIALKKLYLLHILVGTKLYNYFAITDAELLVIMDVPELSARLDSRWRHHKFYFTPKRPGQRRSMNREAQAVIESHNFAHEHEKIKILGRIHRELAYLEGWFTELPFYERKTAERFLQFVGYNTSLLLDPKSKLCRAFRARTLYISFMWYCILIEDFSTYTINQTESLPWYRHNFMMGLGMLPVAMRVTILKETDPLWMPAGIGPCWLENSNEPRSVFIVFHTDRCQMEIYRDGDPHLNLTNGLFDLSICTNPTCQLDFLF